MRTATHVVQILHGLLATAAAIWAGRVTWKDRQADRARRG